MMRMRARFPQGDRLDETETHWRGVSTFKSKVVVTVR